MANEQTRLAMLADIWNKITEDDDDVSPLIDDKDIYSDESGAMADKIHMPFEFVDLEDESELESFLHFEQEPT